MLKKYVKKILNKFGYKKLDNRHIINISKDPLNANLHIELAKNCLKNNNYYLALSEFKTAEYLGSVNDKIQEYKDQALSKLPDPETMNHNQYFRFKTLADELNRKCNGKPYSVLDVGGGMGELATFIPEASYCLVEPDVNGISGTALPFEDKAFDFVVSCHVLEHIPIEERNLFLDQLISKSKKGLILLNPFYVEGLNVDKIAYDVTGAEWAKEHLECTLPYIEDIEKYAVLNNLQLEIKPNGTLTTTLALVFMDYFQSKAGLLTDYWQVNTFFNNINQHVLNNEKYPTAYLVYLGK